MIGSLAQKTIFWYCLLFAAFVSISFYAFQSTYLLQQESNAKEKQQARENLETLVQVWESGIFSRVDAWLNEITTEQDIKVLEDRLRRSTPWFDSIYQWDQTQVLYPPLHRPKTPNLTEDCELALNRGELEPCLQLDQTQTNYASLIAARKRYRRGGREDAILNLKEGRPSLTRTIAQLTSPEDIDVNLFLQRKLLLAQLESEQGKSIERLLKSLSEDIYSLNAPLLSPLLPIDNPTRFPPLEAALQRANRRISAYNEIRNNLLRSTPPQVHSDPYSTAPYLLVTKRKDNQRYLAVQIDPFLLLEEIFSSQPEATLRPVVIDAERNPLPAQFAPLGESEEVWVEIFCGRLFPHLRAAYIRKKPETGEIPSNAFSLFLPLLLAATIAGFAMWGSLQAERKQREFIDRQQAFVARVTHELKTPLAGIRLMAESLQLGVIRSPKQGQQFAERIISETDRLEKRIDEVLQASRKAEIKSRVLLEAEHLIRELHQEWSPRFQEQNGILRIEIEGEPQLFGDPILIKDALQNLLSNAIKYRREDRSLRSILRAEDHNRYVEFSVSDNGLGVPAQERKNIFQRFIRVEGPHRGLAGGHGLGLAFVKETAQVHNGTVRCVDGLMGGAKFILRLPKR
ncbi:MAG: HAMP domain-containing sensor histidine kinase [Myxococcota bacterium]|nr:HAMP domain-containing sensor histidine kinase [Myxococcota bacterium]